jgi:hypothetical protein
MSPESFCGIFVSTCEYLRGKLSILEEKKRECVLGKKEREKRKKGKGERKMWRVGSGEKEVVRRYREGRKRREGKRKEEVRKGRGRDVSPNPCLLQRLYPPPKFVCHPSVIHNLHS